MLAYRKATVLDQEKSKLSLSQIYEQQFLKQTQVCAGKMLTCGLLCDTEWLIIVIIIIIHV